MRSNGLPPSRRWARGCVLRYVHPRLHGMPVAAILRILLGFALGMIMGERGQHGRTRAIECHITRTNHHTIKKRHVMLILGC